MSEEFLAHIGVLHRSGRYPWGSGRTPHQRNRMFIDTVEQHHQDGMSESEIAKAYELTTTQLRALKTIAKTEQRQANVAMALRLREPPRSLSNVAIGAKMGIPESSVRSLLNPALQEKNDILATTASMLRDNIQNLGAIQVGIGVETHLGISKEKLATAVAVLQEEGYAFHKIQTDQLTTGKKTIIKVLAPPGTTYVDLVKDTSQIHLMKQVSSYSEDGGRTFESINSTPTNFSSKRLAIRYKEQGGDQADGILFIRPGVPDVSLGGGLYKQVRVAVDGTHYIKGMAMYKDDLPAGIDIEFNTPKHDTGNKLEALKPLKSDKDLPFGSIVRQSHYIDASGKRKLSAINIVNDEADWDEWSRNLASQMLSKQKPELAKQQLAMTFERKKLQFDEIMSLTNPAVKRKMLEELADSADSAAMHLKAAALPGQKTHVILPFSSLKPDEIYAPNYTDGTHVVLIRYPHGGIFEIPELVVNNRSRKIKAIIGNAVVAVGIHPSVAEKLSGADFDGDTVVVIPNQPRGLHSIQTSDSLDGLRNFDPKRAYPKYEGMKVMTSDGTQQQMGNITNLITDMNIKGATHAELARAVRHSMVVIDAEKKELNYKQSAKDHGIAELKAKYQAKPDGSAGGASTLISRAASEVRVDQRKQLSGARGINPVTGEKVYEYSGKTYPKRTTSKRTGIVTERTIKKTVMSTRMAETPDARTLVSSNGGKVIERVYADHANRLKALANTARKETLNIKSTPYSPSAKTAYAKEVASLAQKLNTAQRNAPLERQAQLVGKSIVKAKLDDNPGMSSSELKKVQGRALLDARNALDAKKQKIEITKSEWDAIQAGAITNNRLTEILRHTDPDKVKALALPRINPVMSKVMLTRALSMQALGYTQAEISTQLGIPATTIGSALMKEG